MHAASAATVVAVVTSTAEPSLLSVGEAAAIAKVSRTHVWRFARAGAFPAVVVGERSGPIRIPREAFIEWLLSRTLERGR